MSINTFFILASTSKSRKFILKKLNLNFKTIKPNCDEGLYKKNFKKLKYSPEKISLELSKNKAKSVNYKFKNKLVIGSDTVINYKGSIIEKAQNLKQAQQRIKKLSGKTHTIISSVAAYYNQKLIWSNIEKTKVKIRKLNILEIKNYLKNSGPTILNSTGCYQIEKYGPIIIENIEGDFFNMIENSWSCSSVKEGKLKVCANKCGTEFDAYKSQWK